MTGDEVNAFYLAKAVAMFPRIDGQPCVNLDGTNRVVHVCNRLYNLSVDDGITLVGTCDWVLPHKERPDELTDGLSISYDLLDVGDNWWLDIYFNWYLIFTPSLVERSLKGDHSWSTDFLRTIELNRTISRPPPFADNTHLLPDAEALKYCG